ncbi:MAG: metalloregulator ArsR/SmtB family transcription factor [Pseudomonadota bacterium]
MAYEMLDGTFRALSDPRRRAILAALREGEMSVADLTARFDVSQPAISQHLAVLRQAELVKDRRDGRRRLHSVDGRRLAELADWVATYEAFWDDGLAALSRHLDRRS